MAVGFSGESSQVPVPTPPPCPWSGRATASKRAMPKSRSDGFFIGVSSIGKVLSRKSNVNAQKFPLDNTLVYGATLIPLHAPGIGESFELCSLTRGRCGKGNRPLLNEMGRSPLPARPFPSKLPHRFLGTLQATRLPNLDVKAALNLARMPDTGRLA